MGTNPRCWPEWVHVYNRTDTILPLALSERLILFLAENHGKDLIPRDSTGIFQLWSQALFSHRQVYHSDNRPINLPAPISRNLSFNKKGEDNYQKRNPFVTPHHGFYPPRVNIIKEFRRLLQTCNPQPLSHPGMDKVRKMDIDIVVKLQDSELLPESTKLKLTEGKEISLLHLESLSNLTGPHLCYSCGEHGHFANDCLNPWSFENCDYPLCDYPIHHPTHLCPMIVTRCQNPDCGLWGHFQCNDKIEFDVIQYYSMHSGYAKKHRLGHFLNNKDLIITMPENGSSKFKLYNGAPSLEDMDRTFAISYPKPKSN